MNKNPEEWDDYPKKFIIRMNYLKKDPMILKQDREILDKYFKNYEKFFEDYTYTDNRLTLFLEKLDDTPDYFVNFFIRFKQYSPDGYCYDCDQYNCICETCPDCGFDRCLCSLDIRKAPDYTANERIRLFKVIFELAKIFNEKFTRRFKRLLLEKIQRQQKYITGYHEFKDFIESVNEHSYFPEYRIIAINLLEIDWVLND